MNCNYCKYTTEIKCNYQKHLSSNKHKKMYEEYKLKYNTKTENKDILENNEEENFIKNYEFKISKKVNNKIKENVESDSDSESENENNKIANNDNNICIYGNTKLIENKESNVWCPQTENGTWVMMQETEGRGIITITGNSGALVKCRKKGASNWGKSKKK